MKIEEIEIEIGNSKSVGEFHSDIEMSKWLANESNLEELKAKYPPGQYAAEINLIDKQIIVTRKK